MRGILFFVVISFSFIYSCKHSNDNFSYSDTNQLKTITIDPDNVKVPGNASEIFSEYDFILLETKKESLIGSIDQLIIHDNKFIIMDELSKSVFSFDKRGKFLNKISAVGNGPGEYQNLNSIYLDTLNSQLILLCSKKVLCFDIENFKFIREEIFKNNLYASAWVAPDTFCVYRHNANWNSEYNLSFFTGEKILQNYLPINPDFKGYSIRNPTEFNASNSSRTLYFNEYYSDTIYSVTSDGLKANLFVDFGDKKIPSSFIARIGEMQDASIISNESQYANGIYDYFETNTFIHFKYGYKKMINSYFGYKKDASEYHYRSINDDVLLCLYPNKILYATDTCLISWQDVYSMVERRKRVMNQFMESVKDAPKDLMSDPDTKKQMDVFYATKEKYDIIFEKSGLNNLTENDNPALIIYKLNNL